MKFFGLRMTAVIAWALVAAAATHAQVPIIPIYGSNIIDYRILNSNFNSLNTGLADLAKSTITNVPWITNTIAWSSNTASYASNTAFWASNAAAWSSNTAFWASNTAFWASNAAAWSSNTACWASNTALWASNAAAWSSNTAIGASNTAVWSSNAAAWASNAAVWISNSALRVQEPGYPGQTLFGDLTIWGNVDMTGENNKISNACITNASYLETARLVMKGNAQFAGNTLSNANFTNIGNISAANFRMTNSSSPNGGGYSNAVLGTTNGPAGTAEWLVLSKMALCTYGAVIKKDARSYIKYNATPYFSIGQLTAETNGITINRAGSYFVISNISIYPAAADNGISAWLYKNTTAFAWHDYVSRQAANNDLVSVLSGCVQAVPGDVIRAGVWLVGATDATNSYQPLYPTLTVIELP